MTKAKTKTFRSVWDAIADTPEQAANLQARAELMRQIAAIIKANKWKQADAATHCGVTQPRINDLLRGRVSRFSLDALVNIATALGRRVHVELEVVEPSADVAGGPPGSCSVSRRTRSETTESRRSRCAMTIVRGLRMCRASRGIFLPDPSPISEIPVCCRESVSRPHAAD